MQCQLSTSHILDLDNINSVSRGNLWRKRLSRETTHKVLTVLTVDSFAPKYAAHGDTAGKVSISIILDNTVQGSHT